MASLGLPPGEREDSPPTGRRDILLEARNISGPHQPARRGSFCSQRLVCEQTLEILRQVLRSTATARQGGPAAGEPSLEPPQGAAPHPGDSRSLLLIVVLHRRLLEQVAALRAELPPICRLIAPSAALGSGANQPLDKSLASANHRALADLEERLYLVVSRHSMARLSEALADPLLKLEEFLLVFELVNDLVGFVGQRCKQNYSQRGKQLLNELTPVTGCPVLSSSEDDSDDDQEQALQAISQQQRSFGGSTLALAMQSNSQGPPGIVGGANQVKRYSQQERYANYDPTNEFYQQQQQQQQTNNSNSRNNSRCNSRNNSQSNLNLNNLGRPASRQQPQVPGFQLPTSINIVAPSPMGSVRDVSRLTSRGDSPVDTKLFSGASSGLAYSVGGGPRPGSPLKRHSHQDILANMQQQEQQHSALIDKTSQMSLSGGSGSGSGSGGGGGRRSIANCLPGASSTAAARQHCDHKEEDSTGAVDEKSRSELIDELLKTINDDSFNEFIDFNNKLSAAGASGSTASQPDQLNSGAGAVSGSLSTASAVELANAARSKSATGEHGGRYSATSTSPTTGGAHSRRQSCSPAGRAGAGAGSPAPPRSLNLGSAGGATRMARGSVCVAGSGLGGPQPGSTFDNVIRRMSTNFVQNFNKMSGGGGFGNLDQTGGYSQQQYPELNIQQASLSNSATQLRREKSSNSTSGYGAPANSLYVDNQVPARRHSDNTINVPRIQVALSSPSSSGSRTNLNQRASVSASKLANKWKLTAKTNQRESSDKLSPNLGGALTYIRRHSSGNAQGGEKDGGGGGGKNHHHHHHHNNDSSASGAGQTNGGLGAQLLNASPFKTKSSSNLGIDFLMSNRSMKRRYSAASMLGHQTQRKAEDLIDAGMKSVQNMFS